LARFKVGCAHREALHTDGTSIRLGSMPLQGRRGARRTARRAMPLLGTNEHVQPPSGGLRACRARARRVRADAGPAQLRP
jgi:hypothetical protein